MRLAGALLACALAAAAQPARIVSTSPGITEMLFSLGLGRKVAGVTTFCHHPPEAQRIAKIGSYTQPNLEEILALRPDLVIIQKNPIRLGEQLAALRLRVLELDYDTVEGIYTSIRRIGDAAGAAAPAGTLTARIHAGLDDVRRRTGGLKRARVMFVVGRTPGAIEALVVAGKGSYLDELMEIAGGENVFGDSSSAYPKITVEELLARRPDVIIDMGDMSETTGVTEAQKRAVVALWGRLGLLPAVARQRVYAVASDIFVVPGPRAVDAARAFARMLHPEAGL